MPHPIVTRAFPTDPSGLLPAINAETRPYWAGLERGQIHGQHCRSCASVQLPGGPVCGRCGSGDIHWEELSGAATLFAWVRYHRSYLPEFADALPYFAGVVELVPGARMIARIVEVEGDPWIGMALRPIIERWPNGRCVPVFAPDRA